MLGDAEGVVIYLLEVVTKDNKNQFNLNFIFIYLDINLIFIKNN